MSARLAAATRPAAASRVGAVLLGCVLFAGCTSAAPATPPPATSVLATAVAPTDAATVPPTRPPATATPEIIAIEATFEPDVAVAPAGAIEITMSAVPAPVFAPREVTAPAGTITLFLTNPDARVSAQHDLKIGRVLLQAAAATPRLLPGDSGVLTLEDVEAGEYIFWCTFNNHYLGGMQGVLTVTP